VDGPSDTSRGVYQRIVILEKNNQRVYEQNLIIDNIDDISMGSIKWLLEKTTRQHILMHIHMDYSKIAYA